MRSPAQHATVLFLVVCLAWISAATAQTVTINEIRIDQPSTDYDEYFELAGEAGTSLDGLTYLVIGDGSAGSGVIEAVVDLAGQSIPASGFFVAAEATFALGTADLTTDLNFENSDNVTHVLVAGFTGANGDDLDSDDDGVLDVTPWTAIADLIAVIEEDNPPSGTEYHYGPPTVGPDGSFVPGHAFTCPDGWRIGAFDPADGDDSPGAANVCTPPLPDVTLSEIRIDQPSTDDDEYFELAGEAGTSLDRLTYLVIGDGAAGSGVIEAIVDLGVQTIPPSGFFVAAESTFTLGSADMVTNLNFENSDNVTHLLVADFAGSDGEDLDTDDDGVLDVVPWSAVLDCVGLVETPGSGELIYCSETVGPDGSFVPGHAFSCPDGWQIGAFDPTGGDDTPGAANPCASPIPEVTLSEIRIDQPSADNDEYFELAGEAGASLDGLTYLVIGDGSAGSGVIEAVVDLAGESVPTSGFFVAAEATFALGTADLTTDLNFENSDNVTHLLVAGFTGANGDDLDTDDDGVLDVVPWSSEVDCVALVETPGSGDQIYCSDTVGPDGSFVPGHAFDCPEGWQIGSFDPVGGDDTPGSENSCGGGPPQLLEIFEIQGSGAASPFDGMNVETRDNIVTAVAAQGFFIQTPDARSDGNSLTSDGIFVFTSTPPTVSVGDQVDVIGSAAEYFDFTEISGVVMVTVDSAGNPLPSVQTIDETIPSDVPAIPAELERFEGMRVTAAGIATGPSNRFGDVSVLARSVRSFREPGIEWPGLPGLPVWDGNPEIFELDPDGLGLPDVAMFTGQEFAAEGALGFAFGSYQLLPSSLTVGPIPDVLRPVRDRQVGEFTVASQNLLFLVAGDANLALRIAKLSWHIRDVLGAPDILAVQEVDTIDMLQTVADQIAADDPTIVYTPYLMQGQPYSDIEVGFLVRDTVVVNDLIQFGLAETFMCDSSERTTFDRPPLVLDAEYAGAGEPFPITVIANHLRSLNGIEDDPCVRAKRHEQALRLSQYIQTLQGADPEIRLVVTGDFNAFQFTDGYVDVMGQVTGDLDPLGALVPGTDEVDPNLSNEILFLPQSERYSYIFDGNAQGFDYMLTSTGIDPFVTASEYSRGNADAPDSLFLDGSTPMRVSDHDAVILFLFNDADLDGVPNELDVCPGTVIPESVPTVRLETNRWALVDDDGIFDTNPPKGGGGGPDRHFTIDDTAGCSCEQIIDELHLGGGHTKFGCSTGAMENWIRGLQP